MKRNLYNICFGILVAFVAYLAVFQLGTSKYQITKIQEKPELVWLKTEFGLSDDEYNRISDLHNAYLPKCEEMCMLVAGKNALLRQLMHSPEAKEEQRNQVIEEVAQLRADCQTMMLKHFYHVSQGMNPEARDKYLEWVLSKTLTLGHEVVDETLHVSHD